MDDQHEQAAAVELISVQKQINEGPFYAGNSREPGKLIDIYSPEPSDNIKRYTDKYLQRRTIGNTIDTYAFEPAFFPPELRKFVGIKDQAVAASHTEKDKLVDLEIAASRAEREEDQQDDKEDADKEDANDSEPEPEDEFEEFEDDDYNAEKYFDDGDDFNDIDEDAGEAAY